MTDLEKTLCLKFSLIVSQIAPPDFAFTSLICPPEELTAERMENRSVLVMLNPRYLNKILEYGTQAQAKHPFTTITIVTPEFDLIGNIFSGWTLTREFAQPGMWHEIEPGTYTIRRDRRKFRAYHAWPQLPTKAQTPKVHDGLFSLPGYTGLNLTFHGKMAKAPAHFLMDTGAADNFVSEQYCKANGIAFTACNPTSYALGDDTSHATVVGECKVMIQIKTWRALVPFKVMNLNNAFAAILGVPIQKKWRALLDMDNDTVTIRGAKKTHVLEGVRPKKYRMPRKMPRVKPSLLVIKQVEREFRKGTPMFLAFVKQIGGAVTCTPQSSEEIPYEEDADDQEREPTTVDNAPEVIKPLLTEFADVFEAPPAGLPPERHAGHTIPLEPGHAPPWRPVYRLSPAEKEEAERQVKEYLEKGWIRPSRSPYGAPILFVKKKDGSLRMCVDYRALNKITVKNRYPLPRIDDLFDQLQGAKYFTSFDLSQGYHQIRIPEEDVPKTAFNTPMGHFEFRVLSFGLTNAPATFQSVMNGIFGHVPFTLVYLDDILVFSKTQEEHLEHVRQVLNMIRENKLYCKLSKCSFLQTELEYLGHLVGADGVRVNPKKVQAVQEFPRPTNVSELRAFLGLSNYFRKFIQNYADTAHPLTAQTGKNSILTWDSACDRAFNGIKDRLTKAPVLALPDPDKTFVVETDASVIGIGAVLMQDGRPVAYESRKLIPAERNYTTTEQELLGVVHALKTWRCYLEGAKYPFVVRTDHNPLTYLPTQPNLSRRQARWSEYLQRFHFTWEYKTGKTNSVADALSRMPITRAPGGCINLLAVVHTQKQKKAIVMKKVDNYAILTPWRNRIRAGYLLDPQFQKDACTSTVTKYGLHPSDGFFWKGDAVVVPDVANLRKEIFEAFHNPAMAGHFGVDKTGVAITEHYWWPGHTIQIRDWVRECSACQLHKPHNSKPKGLLQPLPVPENAWDSVSCDFITGLPETPRGHDAIMVVVDRLTKMAHFIPTTTSASAMDVARLFYENVWCRHGLSLDNVSDRDSRFTSNVWDRLCEMWPMARKMSTSFHPQTDGQTERTNRTLEQMLRMYVSPDMTDWDLCLAPAEFAYNNARSDSTGYSPFFLNYGRHPRVPAALIKVRRGNSTGQVPAVEDFVGRMDQLRVKAREHIIAAQQRQKYYADLKRDEAEFQVGDKVLLSTKNLKLKTSGARKLMPKYIGPFKIIDRVGQVAYRLKLPAQLRIHPVFHVSLLHEYRASGPVQPPPWQLLAEDGQAEVERILCHRDCTRGTTVVKEYLVLWTGRPEENATWVPETRISHDLISEYWSKYVPNRSPALEPPCASSLRRSRRLLGLDTENDSHVWEKRSPDVDPTDIRRGGVGAVMGSKALAD